MQSQDKNSFSLRTWLEWILLTSTGWALIGIFIDVVNFFNLFILFILIFFFNGIPVGIAQWYSLRWRINEASLWIWVTVIGWCITWVIFIAELIILGPIIGSLYPIYPEISELHVEPSPILIITLIFLAVGIPPIGLGIAQWVVLRQSFYQTGWWILATVVSFVVGMFVGIIVSAIVSEGIGLPFLSGFILFTLFGAINGLITGGVLGWMLSKPKKTPEESYN